MNSKALKHSASPGAPHPKGTRTSDPHHDADPKPLPGESLLAFAERKAGLEVLTAGADLDTFLKAVKRWDRARRKRERHEAKSRR